MFNDYLRVGIGRSPLDTDLDSIIVYDIIKTLWF